MKPGQLAQAIESCRTHLDRAAARGSEVEKYLTAYLVVLACSTFEEALETAIAARAEKSGDPVLASLVSSAIGIVLRSIKTSELAGVLNRFSEDHKRSFQQKMATRPQAETAYNSLIAQRHGVAHTSSFTLTFDELVGYVEMGHTVLDDFIEVVNS